MPEALALVNLSDEPGGGFFITRILKAFLQILKVVLIKRVSSRDLNLSLSVTEYRVKRGISYLGQKEVLGDIPSWSLRGRGGMKTVKRVGSLSLDPCTMCLVCFIGL